MIGRTLAHFSITGKLGEGGMGEVYRARDTQLDRDVALKILPPGFSDDPERSARFQREAKVLASLNHPHIAAIYGIHQEGKLAFLTMELVAGEDLASRLEKGPLPQEEVLRIALHTADALEAAHEKGVIHRDLKPANIQIGTDGRAKVLDFGLAKAMSEGDEGGDPLHSPTITAAHTIAGTILGTAGYMSPEQAAGQTADRRCDIWSFGVVLYEMLAGRRLFEGETVSHTLAAVLKDAPDWGELPEGTPRALRRLLERCLERDPRRRLRDMGEARVVLEDLVSGSMEPEESVSAAVETRAAPRLPWIVAAAATVIAAASLFLLLEPSPPPDKPVGRFTLATPNTGALRQGDGLAVALAPDGRRVVTCGSAGADDVLYLREFDDFEARAIDGTSGARLPSFSPDGRWLAFATPAGLRKVNLRGGPAMPLSSFAALPGACTWSPDGYLYFTSAGKLWRTPTTGGEAEVVLEEDDPGRRLGSVSAMPSGILLLISTRGSMRNPGPIFAFDPKTKERKSLDLQGTDCRFVPSGHLVYSSSDQVFAVGFDPDALVTIGSSVPVLERVMIDGGIMQFDVSDDGAVVYVPQRPGEQRKPVLVDREGVVLPLIDRELPFTGSNDVRLSRDGRLLVTTVGRGSVWILDLETETPTLVSENGFYPVWSPDGSSLIYGTTRHKSFDLYQRPVDLSQAETLLLDQENNLRSAEWAGDGSLLFREEVPGKGMDLRRWRVPGDESTIESLLDGPDDELAPTVSPDGRWMAYVSDQSGRDEIYVTSFPEPGGLVQVSASGGTSPAWASDGSELFYFQNNELIAVSVTTDPTFRVLKRESLFNGHFIQYRWYRQYDVHPDGEHFVMVEAPAASELEIVINWFSELERAVAAAR